MPFSTPSRYERYVLALGLALAFVILWANHSPAPPARAVDGTYRNSCCAPITLTNGVLISGPVRVPFELRAMKYGWDTDMQFKVEVQGGRVVFSQSSEHAGFLFDDSHRAFTLCSDHCGPGHEFTFARN